jgi:DNA (cytosine-5)-methyltransferase 1
MKSIELFAGADGLALGLSKAGFKHQAVIEWDKDACATMRDNKRRRIAPIPHVSGLHHYYERKAA